MTADRARDDLLETLAAHRGFLRHTAAGLTDEQAASTPTVSELCIGGLIKHVTLVESNWARFIVEGSAVMEMDEQSYATHAASFRMLPGETLAGLLDEYERVAKMTDELVRTVPSLDDEQIVPAAPWAPEPTARTARRTFLHIVAETAQHAGHADIIREAIDGAKTMG